MLNLKLSTVTDKYLKTFGQKDNICQNLKKIIFMKEISK